MSEGRAVVVSFALSDRWIVTVECERCLVKARHRCRRYAIARREGHEERRHWCDAREDALYAARLQREAFERLAELDCLRGAE